MQKWIGIMGIIFMLTGCKMSEAPTSLMGALPMKNGLMN